MRRLRVREEVDGRTMADKTTDSVIPAEVSGLIDESQRIQGWIARLADFEKETSPAVYEKVLTDYQSRLSAVTGKLAAHRVDLVGTLERHRAEVDSWRSERSEHAAELEEAKLRHAVGELADSDWDKRRSSIDGKLASLDDRISARDDTVAELESIISAIPAEGEEGAAKIPSWMSGLGKEAAEGKPAKDEPGAEAGLTGEDEPAGAEADEDEIAVAVAEEEPEEEEAGGPSDGQGGAPDAREAEKAAASDETPADEDEYLDELEFLESLSLEESDRFDAVSAMLEEDEGGKRASE